MESKMLDKLLRDMKQNIIDIAEGYDMSMCDILRGHIKSIESFQKGKYEFSDESDDSESDDEKKKSTDDSDYSLNAASKYGDVDQLYVDELKYLEKGKKYLCLHGQCYLDRVDAKMYSYLVYKGENKHGHVFVLDGEEYNEGEVYVYDGAFVTGSGCDPIYMLFNAKLKLPAALRRCRLWKDE